MGNQASKPPEYSEEVLASLTPRGRSKLNQMVHHNFFEPASITNDPSKFNKSLPRSSSGQSTTNHNKEKRKWSSSSEESDNSYLITPATASPLSGSTVYSSNVKTNFEVLNGRRYLSSPGSHFFLPCDDEEADRLVILHFLIKYSFDGNMMAPVAESLRVKNDDNPTKVLDIGCGPGTWILEMATEFPNTEFHGIDIRTMFPSSIKPTNTKFLQHDFLTDLPYADETFEFVRMRLMLGLMTEKQLLHLISEIQRVLKPSGYIEILDAEYQIHRAGPICENVLNQQLKNIMHNRDTDFMASHHLSTLLMTQPLNGGFIDVHQHRVTIPIGWGGKLGQVHAQNFGAFLQSIHPLLKNQLIHDNTAANVDDLLIQAVKECSANQSHMKWFVCYGQKPADMLGITPPLPCSSVKNSISMQYPTNTAQMITPNASPSLKGFQQKEEDESTWDSINDFVDGYID